MATAWDPDFFARSVAFAPLQAAARELRCAAWPTCDDFNRLLAARCEPLLNAAGLPLRFVAQMPRTATFEERYEPRIFLRGEVQMRAGDWHDVFNALVWLTFPRAKAALNARHYGALAPQREAGARNRGPVQDALTLFDEGGVIVATTDARLRGMLEDHAWKELFWHARAEVTERMRFALFGHALYAKMREPYAGVNGRGIICKVAAGFFALPPADQLVLLDTQVAAHIAAAQHLTATRELVSVPLLGIPGWCSDNESAAYFEDAAYFRPPRADANARPR